ncbi:hypothetical protein A3J19_04960 [Candidatus Daviesbacteria bacterium RIFCSPLOWO2_02_FULL_41_8]|uniref:IPT/TIG domain-containing protein n=1 Tax=Candidatus Daviesbacteria bacterium RIFCSPLOWO2_02_FULL_41_8 TaxID=1797798 RepID=A0A1F5NJB9_9BACT|nr:MAG: hypothetical protein A3J19_04960 [Candidatus Daviesbacteria bacterium RIFCSPLOWO2_02_FULL_41_8]
MGITKEAMKWLTVNIIPKILCVIWLLFVVSYLREVNYFSLSIDKTLPPVSLGLYRGDPLLQGQSVLIDFISDYQKLGAIGVSFNTFYKVNNDILRFRIKEVGQEGWYYENDYTVDQFQQNKVFTFRFPVIDNSVGKIYRAELESLKGASGEFVAITSPLTHSVIAKHIFTKTKLLSDTKVLIYFAYHKLIFLFSDPEFLNHLFLFSIPLLYYLTFSLVGFSMGAFSVIIFLSILFDIIYTKEYSSFLIFSVIYGWGLMAHRHNVESRVSSSVFLAVFSLSPILYLIGQAGMGDKAAVWAYIFLAFSMTQSILEIKGKPKSFILIKDYWRDLVVEGRNMGLFIYLIITGEINVGVERVRLGLGKKTTEISDFTKRMRLGLGTKTTEISATVNNRNPSSANPEGLPELITLVLYRWEAPMLKTYIYTSQFLAYLIISIVRAAGLTLRYGPFALFGWLVWSTIDQVRGYLDFFQEFFVQNQDAQFWDQIGNSMVSIYLVVLVIFLLLLFLRRLDLRRKTLVGIVILYLCTVIAQSVFDRSTPYRDDLKIWSVSPNETAEPWVDVTITGRNFGETPFLGKVYINGVEQRIMKWEKNEIIFRTNPLTTRSGHLAIRGYNKTVSNAATFTYTGNR